MIKIYYKIEFEMMEPLSLGNGENRYSDIDLLKDGQEKPFIPGSSLCGIYRSCLGDVQADRYFGKRIIPGSEEMSESTVKVYDAVLKDSNYTLTIRDSVGLDEYKTAIQGAKFDFEILEPGAVFTTYLEQDLSDEADTDIGEIIAAYYLTDRIRIGRKTMRGYGKTGHAKVWMKKFILPERQRLDDGLTKEEEAALSSWLDFDMYEPDAFLDSDSKENDIKKDIIIEETFSRECTIELNLKQSGGISIRKYTTELTGKEDDNQPDYTQMFYKGSDGKEYPCIPGTSWAGAFCHHISNMLPDEKKEDFIHQYFGMISKEQAQKSKVRFSESQIKDTSGEPLISKIITRTAIDRFTGGASKQSLYTEKTFFEGTTSLEISFPKCVGEDDPLWRHMLAAAITDLDEGFLSIGGLTSIGRGLFHVESCLCNGVEIYSRTDDSKDALVEEKSETPKLYTALVHAMEEVPNGSERKTEEEMQPDAES